MTATQRLALAIAVLFLVGSGGFFLGTRVDAASTPGADSAEVGFLWDMIAHHEQALTMSKYQIADGTHPRVTHFADEILQGQSYEIGLMEAYLARWGQPRERPGDEASMGWMGMATPTMSMPGMASDAQLDELADALGPRVDALFVQLMIEHHRGGVAMATAASEVVEDPTVRALAERMAGVQAVEIKEMQATRDALDLPVDPLSTT